MVYFVASVVPLDTAARQELLETDPVTAKLRRLVDLLQKEIATVVKSPEIKGRLLEMGVVPEGDSPASFAAYVKADIAKWKRVIEQANVPKI